MRQSIKVIKQSTVSTGHLNTFRHLQLRPINRVVFSGSLGSKLPWNPRLGIDFTLRCFQRLFVPDIATSDAASATTGTPGVRPSKSSRTMEEVPSRFLRPQQIGTDLAHAGLNPARVPL